MGGFYGYNPGDFRTDFSWLGDIGAAVSKAANAFPELWDLNQQIKENRFFKQKAYTEILEWIDWLDDTKVTNIASSMGLQYDPNDPQQARNLLKQQILDPSKLSDKLSNEDYVKRLAIDSIAPIVEAAKTKANGVLTEGDLLAGFKSGVTREAFKNYTTTGKAMMEDEQYQKTFNRRFGRGGELETELGMRNQSQLDLDQQKYDIEQQRKQESGQRIAPIVDKIIRSGMSSDLVYAEVFKQTNDPEAAKEAAERVRVREEQDLRAELRRMQDEARKTIENQKDLAKVYDLSKVEDDLAKVNKDIAMLSNNVKDIKDLSAKADFEATIDMMKQQQRVLLNIKKYLIKNGGSVTQDQYNKANLYATMKAEEDASKQKMIDRYNSGKYRSFWLSREAEKEKFINEFKTRFGEEPTVEDIERAGLPSDDEMPSVTATANKDGSVKVRGYNSQDPTSNVDMSKAINVDDGTWTIEKINALPEGSVIKSKDGRVLVKRNNQWVKVK